MNELLAPDVSQVPELESYSTSELTRARAWPAVDRYLRLLDQSPTKAPPESTAAAKADLRRYRHRLWLRAAIATFHGRPNAQLVCAFWSAAADELIARAWNLSECADAGFALLALGKLGSRELNLSSDVDLIMVRADQQPPNPKAFRDFQSLLSEHTEDGYALRVDFTLRPGGKSSSAQPTVGEFEYHYGYHGEMWERLAFVRMRILQGPPELQKAIGDFCRKFSYRKHLDYTLLESLKSLRGKIRQEKFQKQPGIFDLKLGTGGIRELELFVHALQVLHGGRNQNLQTTSTTDALQTIENLAMMPTANCQFLRRAYWQLRTIENRVHAFEDQQTYLVDLVNSMPALEPGTVEQLPTLCERVTDVASSFFEDAPTVGAHGNTVESQQIWLEQKGFSKESRDETWPQLLAATAVSRRTEADEQARLNFLGGFVEKLAELNLDLDLGLSILLDFVRATRAKASFFTMLNRESRVRDELALLFSISPYLGSILASRPELIDEFIFRKQADPSPDLDTLLEDLAERRLLAELISATQYLNDQDLRKMLLNLSSNADEIATTVLDRLKRADAGTPSASLRLIALGKWGGREMGLRSDLDFVFVTVGAPTTEDHRIAKRFLSRMTEPHRGGSIYQVDMRLRPSGQSGPIMVDQAELERYLREDAAAWERQAYLRARALGELAFRPSEVAAQRGLSPADLDELRRIREKLFTYPSVGEIDLKLNIGGLADVEFVAQIACLARRRFSLDPSTSGMVQYLESFDTKWNTIGPQLREDYDQLRGIEQLFQLTTRQSGSKIRLKSDEFKRLALILKTTAETLETRIRSVFKRVQDALEQVRD